MHQVGYQHLVLNSLTMECASFNHHHQIGQAVHLSKTMDLKLRCNQAFFLGGAHGSYCVLAGGLLTVVQFCQLIDRPNGR